MSEERDHSHLWDNKIEGHSYTDNCLEVAEVTVASFCLSSSLSGSLSLPRFPDFPKTFAEFRAGEGERADISLCCPSGRWPGVGGGVEIWGDGPSSESAEETRGAGFLWGLRPRRPADRRVRPRQRPARRGGRDVVRGATGKARRGRGGGGPAERGGERRAGEERGGRRERGRKGGGEPSELAPEPEEEAGESGGGAGGREGPSGPSLGRPQLARMAGPAR